MWRTLEKLAGTSNHLSDQGCSRLRGRFWRSTWVSGLCARSGRIAAGVNLGIAAAANFGELPAAMPDGARTAVDRRVRSKVR